MTLEELKVQIALNTLTRFSLEEDWAIRKEMYDLKRTDFAEWYKMKLHIRRCMLKEDINSPYNRREIQMIDDLLNLAPERLKKYAEDQKD